MPEIARKAEVDTVDSPDGTPGDPCPGDVKCNSPSIQATKAGSSDVFIMGIGVVRETDKMKSHPSPACGCAAHAPTLTVCSSRVYANGLRIGRKGDAYGGDHIIISGAPTVFDGSAQYVPPS